ncbi:hypothetical protein ARMSODRAFT_963843 [Armillaria solidipes]|uniref:Uncharacterized protein n=1 Tax=Armillaria solidipes TaxID=1076256 RepID=A0A2H3AVL0_9AGAR|nr:hypothetical protein ARMSODRAFT_964310 [Armillaria solidipes]PBK62751.1 hypothetical protein ARMSODRAFT_963843 [Armillaria solidipes]
MAKSNAVRRPGRLSAMAAISAATCICTPNCKRCPSAGSCRTGTIWKAPADALARCVARISIGWGSVRAHAVAIVSSSSTPTENRTRASVIGTSTAPDTAPLEITSFSASTRLRIGAQFPYVLLAALDVRSRRAWGRFGGVDDYDVVPADITVVRVRTGIQLGLVSHAAPCLWVKGPWSFFDDAPKGVPDVRVVELGEGLLSITDLADDDGHDGERKDGKPDN